MSYLNFLDGLKKKPTKSAFEDDELPSNVKVEQIDENAWRATASFEPDPKLMEKEKSKEKPKTFAPLKSFTYKEGEKLPKREDVQKKLHSGLDDQAYGDMQKVLEKDPDQFNQYDESMKNGYEVYQKKRRQHYRPDRKPHHEDQVNRNAVEAGREAGAGSFIDEDAKRSFFDAATDAAHGAVVLSGGDQDQLDEIEKTRKRKRDENHTPDIYKGRTAGNHAGDIYNLNPMQGALSGAGEMARDLEKAGISREGQQIGAAIMGLVSFAGKDVAKVGAREIKDQLVKRFGQNWAKRLRNRELETINEELIGHGLQIGAGGLIEQTGKLYKDIDEPKN